MKAASSAPIIQKVLLADIGGTNARFALLAGGTVGTIAHMAVSDYGSFHEALGVYLGSICRRLARSAQQFLRFLARSRTTAVPLRTIPG